MFYQALHATANTGMPKLLMYTRFFKQNSSRSVFLLHPKSIFINNFLKVFHCQYCRPALYKELPLSVSFRTFSTLHKQPVIVFKCEHTRASLPANFSQKGYRSQQHNASQKRSLQDEKIPRQKFNSLYLLEHIRLFRFIGVATRISTFVAALGYPVTLGLYMTGTIMPEIAMGILGALTINSLIFLVPSALFTSRVIGKIMLSEDQKYLKISRLSIFGKRKDIYVQPQDLIVYKGSKIRSLVNAKAIKLENVNESKKLLFFPLSGTEDSDSETLSLIFNEKK